MPAGVTSGWQFVSINIVEESSDRSRIRVFCPFFPRKGLRSSRKIHQGTKHTKHNKNCTEGPYTTEQPLVTRTSCRYVAIAAPILKPSWPCQWKPENLRACALKDQRFGAAVVVIEPLNRCEEPVNTTITYARQETLTSLPREAGRNLWESFFFFENLLW